MHARVSPKSRAVSGRGRDHRFFLEGDVRLLQLQGILGLGSGAFLFQASRQDMGIAVDRDQPPDEGSVRRTGPWS